MTHDAAAAAAAAPPVEIRAEPQQQQQQQQQQQHTSQPMQEATASSSNSSDSSSSSSSSSSRSHPASCWQLVFCERDRSADDAALPKGPHPRTSPELVVLAQLQALQQQDVVAAAGFNMLGRHASGSGWDAHLAAFRHLLGQPLYSMLCKHSSVELGSSALPSQRHFLQEVVLQDDGSSSISRGSSSGSRGSSRSWDRGGERDGSGSEGRFLWRLGMQADGCWMVRSIEVL
ncbi:hypothetical protein COO60DRAFT_1565249 [Scenedesmus sp. NREL 46B-D3]|nr:hypothetical protein COO60DRAFT_1565249 [Scenedesmus sp. NREL 46B-D3]